MRYLVVRTDVRPLGVAEVQDSWAAGVRPRDEPTAPEIRRQTLTADTREAALTMARALASAGQVRSGRQRIKVVPLTHSGQLGT
jgi:hypothetical protein